MAKKLNNVASTNKLVSVFNESFKKADLLRWANTEEGRIFVAEETRKRENKERRAQFVIGQLIWKDDLAYEEDDYWGNGKITNRCSKIVGVNENDLDVEMLYATIGGERVEAYKDVYDLEWKKGQKTKLDFYRLEKHTSKLNGNIWWKVK